MVEFDPAVPLRDWLTMDLQVVLPNESPEMPADRPAQIAVAAEELGYHTAWLPDHVLPPEEYGSFYGGVYEPLITLSGIAARTSRIRLGTSVLVLPLRDPFSLAKQVATLDRLSGERLTLGLGVGWDKKEFENVGSDFRTRGARTDEAIDLMRALFAGQRSFDGKYYGFDGGVFEPRPRGNVRLMVGGISDAALRRATRVADEWQSVAADPAEFAAQVARLRTFADRPIRVGTRISWDGLESTTSLARALSDAGAEFLAVWFGEDNGYEDRMAAFLDAMRPALRLSD
ncbi:LLM class F420-dependent oxidoreductase [Amycolatopsis albispora]|uniref:LLM class F420-dependent oxidoreductase n=2 Tax=Amycolatopsis albispora TaxID=1804986 RepID=A0A344LA33_9PSEU|nr:LLM class F420-dependent oxidoreductase [Amycolatopsis albispora]